MTRDVSRLFLLFCIRDIPVIEFCVVRVLGYELCSDRDVVCVIHVVSVFGILHSGHTGTVAEVCVTRILGCEFLFVLIG